jgi:hypothetical protein
MDEHHAAALALFRGATEGLGVHITEDWKDPQVLWGFDGPELTIVPGDPILERGNLLRAWICAEMSEHEAAAPYIRAQVLALGERADPARAEHPWDPIVLIQTSSTRVFATGQFDAGKNPIHTRVYTRMTTSQEFVYTLPVELRQRCNETTDVLLQVKALCDGFKANRCMIPL